MDVENRVPSVKFDISTIEERNRWEAWRSLHAGLFDLERRSSEADMHARTDAYAMGNAIVGRFEQSAAYFRRKFTKPTEESEEKLVLLVNMTGSSKSLMGDSVVRNDPSTFTLYDLNQSVEIESEPTQYFGVFVPYSSVGYDPYKHSGVLQLSGTSPRGKMLKSNLQMMLDLAPTVSALEGFDLGNGFLGFLNGLLEDDHRDQSAYESFRAAREVAVHRYIKVNAADPNLSVDTACKDLGLSRAGLFRMLEDVGGFQRAVFGVRLSGARTDLAKLPKKHGMISKVASNWGFTDPAHFSRLFRETYGLTPSDVLGEVFVDPQEEAVQAALKSGAGRDVRQLSKLLHLGVQS